MDRLSFSEFLAVRDEFDKAVLAAPTGEISKFCNSSHWLFPAFLGLHDFDPESQTTFIVREEDSWLVFVEKSENCFYPFESAWLFQNPLVGPDAFELFRKAKATYFRTKCGFLFGGLPKDGSLIQQLESVTYRHFEKFPATDCMLIDLSEGVDSWLARKSRKFRRSIRDSQKRCAEAGVKIEESDLDFARIVSIQIRTVKWLNGSDIFHHDDCVAFYSKLLKENALQLRVATIDGKDAAYLLGAVFGNTFRGLQMSYACEYNRLGLGNLLQIETMRSVHEEYGVTEYDLGMFSEYKSRWADETREFSGCFVVL